jgi:hypothetical protein
MDLRPAATCACILKKRQHIPQRQQELLLLGHVRRLLGMQTQAAADRKATRKRGQFRNGLNVVTHGTLTPKDSVTKGKADDLFSDLE